MASRASVRVRSSVDDRSDDDSLSRDKSRWKLKEKRDLLESIQKNGLADLNKLAKDVKTRNATEVQHFLNLRRQKLKMEYSRQQKCLPQSDSPLCNRNIIKWCDKIKEAINNKYRGKDYSVVLEEIMKSAAEQEESEVFLPGAPNFRLIYSYLGQAISGFIPASLPPLECWVLLHAWRSLNEKLKVSGWSEEKTFLQTLHLRKEVPLDPIFKRLKRENQWKEIEEFSRKKQNIASNVCAASSSISMSELEVPKAEEIVAGTIGGSVQETVGRSLEGTVGRSVEGTVGRSVEGTVGRSIEGTMEATVVEHGTYPLWDLTEHSHGLLLSSLNPLTVPVAMIDKENQILFNS